MVKYYLGHPILIRDKVRAWELGFEQRTGIELINPFYDGAERDDIKKIDAGTQSLYGPGLDCNKIVKGDIGKIVESDGILAYASKTVFSIGTYMEIWIAMSLGKKVYIVSPDVSMHPWLRYCVEHTGGFAVTSYEDFERVMAAEGLP